MWVNLNQKHPSTINHHREQHERLFQSCIGRWLGKKWGQRPSKTRRNTWDKGGKVATVIKNWTRYLRQKAHVGVVGDMLAFQIIIKPTWSLLLWVSWPPMLLNMQNVHQESRTTKVVGVYASSSFETSSSFFFSNQEVLKMIFLRQKAAVWNFDITCQMTCGDKVERGRLPDAWQSEIQAALLIPNRQHLVAFGTHLKMWRSF